LIVLCGEATFRLQNDKIYINLTVPKETAARLKKLGIKSLVFTPCEIVSNQGDFLTVMRQNIKNLEEAFQ